MLRILLFIYITICFKKCECKNYCSADICNNNKQHTLCKFQFETPADRCIEFEMLIKTKRDKEAILDKINSRRNKVASGEIRSLPSASNMLKLEWNTELEVSAQRWANQCVEHRVPDVKDTCRDLDSITVGQNIATIHGDAPGLTLLSLVDVWFIELLHLDVSYVAKYRPSFEAGRSHYDYFTQLVWAESAEVGCGGVKFKEYIKESNGIKNRTIYRLICNFAPGGNKLNESAYLYGEPCSKCPPRGHCSSDFKALCESVRTSASTDKTTKPSNTGISENVMDLRKLNKTVPGAEKTHVTDGNNRFDIKSNAEEELYYAPFDYFSHIHDFTRQAITETTSDTSVCKNDLAFNEFIQLLKIKLTKDPELKNIFTTISNNESIEFAVTDPSVAAFVSRIYSKKSPVTTVNTVENDYVNSTLVMNLVASVIFKGGDQNEATHVIEENTEQENLVSPVRIRPELAEIMSKKDFTDHFFFPEDVDEVVEEHNTTESYYDSSDAMSDVVLEIEQIRKTLSTKGFLDEILESEGEVTESIILPKIIEISKNQHNIVKKYMGPTNDGGSAPNETI